MLDVGITADAVADVLQRSAILTIVGYQGSGKSRLAESLDVELSRTRRVLMQTASSWFQRASARGASGPGTTFDPEIFKALQELGGERESCWIVDDAEVMFAYATERALASLGEQLAPRRFSVILIRNRFVLEGEGWFHQRQSLLAHDMPALTMRPMPFDAALAAASEKFPIAPSRALQAEWLASMSGGVPGLMEDLYRYTPEHPPEDPDKRLLAFAQSKREELELHRPMRQALIETLNARMLPPSSLLSEQARTELGVLVLAGMVSANYASGGEPFHGRFWRLVSRQNGHRGPADDDRFTSLALNLESILADAEVADDVRQACGVESRAAGALAQALSANLFCARHYPPLARPLAPILIETLGRIGLRHVLETADAPAPRGASADEMVALLLAKAGS